MIPTSKQYIKSSLLEETVTDGYSYIILHKSALTVPIPLSKMGIYNTIDNTLAGYMSLSDLSIQLGSLFVPASGILGADYRVVHWGFDERLQGGLSEQQMLRQLLRSKGFTNIRDLNNDGLNDVGIEAMDWVTPLKNLTKKYYCFASAREIKYLPKFKKGI